MRGLLFGLLVTASVAGCSKQPSSDPLQLEGGILAVDNRTPTDWTNVEIWLNRSYRITAPLIPARTRFQAPLNTFVAGFGQRFDYRRAQVKDLRLTAKLPDGRPFELKKQFEVGGLGALAGGKR